MKRVLILLFLLAGAGFLSSQVTAEESELPKTIEDGLVLVEDSRLAAVYAEPGADLGGYNRVNVLPAQVAF